MLVESKDIPERSNIDLTFYISAWLMHFNWKVEYDENGCFLESPYLFGEDEKYAQYMQVILSPSTELSIFPTDAIQNKIFEMHQFKNTRPKPAYGRQTQDGIPLPPTGLLDA